MINVIFRPILEALPENNRLERIWVLAKVDFLKRYYGSFLGLVWAFINPLVQLAIYYAVFTIVFKNETKNFSLFLFLGLICYLFFAEAASKGIGLMKRKRYLLENIPINKLDIYYASIFSVSFAFLFNFAAYFLISLFFPIELSSYVYLVPLLIVNLMMFILAIKLLLSIIHVFLNDIVHIWDLAKMALLWLSGVFYEIDPSATWKTALMTYATPLPGIFINMRKLLIFGEVPDWHMFSYDFAYATVLLGISLIIFQALGNKAVEKL